MRPYARYPTSNGGVFFLLFIFFREGGPVGHKHRLYAKVAILAQRESF